MRRVPVIAGLIAIALMAVACPGRGDDAFDHPSADANVGAALRCDRTSATDESGFVVATLAIADRAFLPSCFAVRGHGQSLRIKNADHITHTFTVDGTDVDVEVAAGTTVKTGGDAADPGLVPGTYPFHCRIHAAMTGVMIVR